VQTLLGGLAMCPCGNVVTGMPSHTGHHIYRCTPATRNRGWRGGHVARQAAPVEEFIEKVVIGRLSRPDAADLIAVPEGGPGVAALREEATAIRRNLEEMAADRVLGRINRAQMLAATNRANIRLGEIGAELEGAARDNVLTPLVAAENAASAWEGLDLSRKRAVKARPGTPLQFGHGTTRPMPSGVAASMVVTSLRCPALPRMHHSTVILLRARPFVPSQLRRPG
jgi:site-specific DNA recombinase